MEPDLFEAYRLVLWSDLPRRPIGSPTSSSEEPAEPVVACVHPAIGTAKAIGPERVRAGVQQPRTMASMLRRRIHDELIDGAVQTRVGILILTGHSGGESHDASAVGRDQDPEGRLRGRSMADRHEWVISVNETDASINSARSAGHWVAQDRRCSSAMLAASTGQARRTESAIGSSEAGPTGVMLSGL